MQTLGRRINQFLDRCQKQADRYSLMPRPASERLLVGLLHDGHEQTCPTLVSWPVTWQELEVGKTYAKRKIDPGANSHEVRLVTVLALFLTQLLSTQLHVGMTVRTIFDTYHTIIGIDGDRVEVESSGLAKTWKQQLTQQQFSQHYLLRVVREGWEIIA